MYITIILTVYCYEENKYTQNNLINNYYKYNKKKYVTSSIICLVDLYLIGTTYFNLKVKVKYSQNQK